MPNNLPYTRFASLLIAIACYTPVLMAQELATNRTTVTYKGNKFVLSEPKNDTEYVPTPKGETIRIRVGFPEVMRMNGERVYTNNVRVTLTRDVIKPTLEERLLAGLDNVLKQLPDGRYRLYVTNVITDKEGKIVYYSYGGISGFDKAGNEIYPEQRILTALTEETERLMTTTSLPPARLNGQNVPARYPLTLGELWIVVRQHKVRIKK